MMGKLSNAVRSQYSSHYLGICYIQHYFCTDFCTNWQGEALVTAWLLHGYCLVTVRLLTSYFLFTTFLLPG